MFTKEEEFLNKLADLCEEYKARFEIYEDHRRGA